LAVLVAEMVEPVAEGAVEAVGAAEAANS